jgi:hypothetical protein
MDNLKITILTDNHKNLDCFSDYQNDIHKLIELIVEESKYIDKIRNDIAESTRNSFTGPEWLTLDFWV